MEFVVKEEVRDELEAVQSIFEKDFSFQLEKNSIICKLNITPTDTIMSLKEPLSLSVIVILSSTYPEEPCICTIEKFQGVLSSSAGSGNINLSTKINRLEDKLNKLAKDCAADEMVALFEIHNLASEWLTNEAAEKLAILEQEKADQNVAAAIVEEELQEMAIHTKQSKKEAIMEQEKFNRLYEEAISRWSHSDTIVDRKSTFQAHVALISSVEESKELMRFLCTDNKIARATHNIWALRIVQPNGVIISDNDDDGETAAGGRLMHLLDMMKVENAVCVVSRWYGGILLGPARFKHINNVARKELEKYGFGGKSRDSKDAKASRKKKNKKNGKS